MPLIRRRRVPLPLEHMSQMPTTVRTHNLNAFHPKRAIRVSRHGARYGIEESRPAAAGFEFVIGGIERRVAARAGVGAARGLVLVVFAGEGGFGAFFAEDAELLYKKQAKLSAKQQPRAYSATATTG